MHQSKKYEIISCFFASVFFGIIRKEVIFFASDLIFDKLKMKRSFKLTIIWRIDADFG